MHDLVFDFPKWVMELLSPAVSLLRVGGKMSHRAILYAAHACASERCLIRQVSKVEFPTGALEC